jgi:hypothetical protein
VSVIFSSCRHLGTQDRGIIVTVRVVRGIVCCSTPPGAHPALHRAQARVLGRPAAHGHVGHLKLRVNDLVGDVGELLLKV